jgi:hypothetical protein
VTRAAWLLVLIGLACKGEPEKRAAAPPPSAARDAAPPAAPGKAPPVKPADEQAPNETDKKEAEALLGTWLAAQSGGDFAGYQTLYGDRFTGVRRSGSKVRRFDRAGWMKDRGRMFEKPMVVAAEAVHVIAHGAQTHLFFTQTFEQGTYKDTGRKWMALERAAGGPLRIAREEMLDSTLIAAQEKELTAKAATASPAAAAGDVQLGWAGKRDKLYLAPIDGDLVIGRASGAIGTGDIAVGEHTTDAASGAIGGVSATRAVDPARLPPALADRIGKTVQILDDDLGPLCHARISGYSLRVNDWAPQGAEDADAAAAALMAATPVVVAELQMSGCPKGAAFARDVDLPALPEAAVLDDAAEAKIKKAVGAQGDDDVTVIGVAGDPTRAIVAATGHTEDSCETQEEYRIKLFLVTRAGKSWKAAPYGDYTYEDSLVAAVDADGDGTIDVFTDRGSHHGPSTSDFWDDDVRVYWPPGLGCDGCEGDECGD